MLIIKIVRIVSIFPLITNSLSRRYSTDIIVLWVSCNESLVTRLPMFQDFCYYANTIFLIDLLFYSSNEKLFMVCFSFAEVRALSMVIWLLGQRMIHQSIVSYSRAFAGAISMGFDCLALQLGFQFSWQNCQCSYPSITW